MHPFQSGANSSLQTEYSNKGLSCCFNLICPHVHHPLPTSSAVSQLVSTSLYFALNNFLLFHPHHPHDHVIYLVCDGNIEPGSVQPDGGCGAGDSHPAGEKGRIRVTVEFSPIFPFFYYFVYKTNICALKKEEENKTEKKSFLSALKLKAFSIILAGNGMGVQLIQSVVQRAHSIHLFKQFMKFIRSG